jgi:hypothetical protein
VSETSTNLLLPYLAAGQAQKHVTVNESLRKLDAVVQLAVTSATTSAEPGAPSDGEVYIMPAGKTGAHWGAMTDWALAYYRDGAWEEITPREGFVAYVRDAGAMLVYAGAAWAPLRTVAGAAGLADDNVFTGPNTFVGDGAFIGIDAYSYGDTVFPHVAMYRARGSFSSPTKVHAGDQLGVVGARGYYDDGLGDHGFTAGNVATVLVFAAEDFSPTAFGSKLTFETTPNGSTTRAVRLAVENNGNVGIGAITAATKLDVDGPMRVRSYTVSGLPSASGIAGAMIYVSNESGGAVLAFSDGTNWRRVTDRAVVS